MNLALHFGLLGVVEAGLIAFAVGMLTYLLWRGLSRAFRFSDARALGWALFSASAFAAGVDAWNLFYLGLMKLESPLYARLALQGIHDPESLGARVVCEAVGAWSGVVAAWLAFSRRWAKPASSPAAVEREKHG
ncbi:hypothetical protein GCM10027084_02740 [Pseudoxanthomonas sangjuensis]|uniref:hypothetical protein n=1 Tax=Pseudoxanthomonas sangjuensis TaxID=1503750 RepID=UPI001390C4D2|nr:hypothetical protein [Pseudoxanthomonas sangjuensis]KAF1713846.1 hypothetical protein CSC71_05560 [Pseudoxanthomonas sangjuensis]